MNVTELELKTTEELQALAKTQGLENFADLSREELIAKLANSVIPPEPQPGFYMSLGGILEIMDEGYGFLRQESLLPGPNDVYISNSQIRRFGLRNGDTVIGQARPPKEGEKYCSLLRVETVNGLDADQSKGRPHFGQLTPTFPDKMFDLESNPKNLSARLINLVAPIGGGQRGLIVSPPKAGKTLLLKNIANAITAKYPDVHLMVLLIGERPEEVTDMKRSVNGEVVSATFDEPVENHTRVAELALERAKRLAEIGKDVVILLDGITRLTRSYNLAMPPSGRTLSGGIDSVALYPPKRFFGAARNIEEGGSLTILATCLLDTGSRMDDLIYEEFKGTGNMELHLDRRMAEKRIFPAIDIMRSSTRREELLLGEQTVAKVWLLRRMIAMIAEDSNSATDASERVIDRLAKTQTNAEFLSTLTAKDV
ncbi:MAG: transcription termination factor Rho [Dehalococcoidia bacterium]|nr:transcription termination factor Rho [Dehalococcoidia bacterium]